MAREVSWECRYLLDGRFISNHLLRLPGDVALLLCVHWYSHGCRAGHYSVRALLLGYLFCIHMSRHERDHLGASKYVLFLFHFYIRVKCVKVTFYPTFSENGIRKAQQNPTENENLFWNLKLKILVKMTFDEKWK